MGELKLTFVNVGYGEAILLECPDPTRKNGTFTMLIDGGSARADEFAGNTSGRQPLTEYLRDGGPDHLDLMVSTHIHEDHICGLLGVAETMLPGELWQTLSPATTASMRPIEPSLSTLSRENFMAALNTHQALCAMMGRAQRPVRTLRAGDAGMLCPELTYRVLAPGAAQADALERDIRRLYSEKDEAFFAVLDSLDSRMNNGSIMLLLDYCGSRILLPGDTNYLGYEGIDPQQLAADIFKVGHHGQLDGADAALLDAVAPKAVVCCASSDRRYNSARPELLQLIGEKGATTYFSDCPQLPGLDLPPHRALTFTVEESGAWSAAYIL